MPRWMANVGLRLSLSEVAMAQLTIGILLASTLTFALLGSWVKPAFIRIALIGYAFCAVATIASAFAGSGAQSLVLPTIGLVAALGLNALADRAAPTLRTPRHGANVWMCAAFVAIWVVPIGVAAQIPIANSSLTVGDGSANGLQRGPASVVLDYAHWQGRTLPDTGLSRLLPLLTALTIEGQSIVILYSPECGHCRELFAEYFTQSMGEVKVIAVEVPPAPGSTPLVGDNLGPIECPSCQWLSLPAGTHYILKPPTILVVKDGRVICATDSDWKACLGDPPSPTPSPTPSPASPTAITP